MDVIYSRRSVRAYTPDTVPESTVRALIDAAVQAPTALGAQSWSFVVVQNPHRLARLSSLTKTEFMQQMAKDPGLYLAVRSNTGDDLVTRFSDPGFDVFYGATTLIVICTRGTRSFGTADCWLAAENLMLAASALGLGSCCIGAAAGALNSAEMRLELAIRRTSPQWLRSSWVFRRTQPRRSIGVSRTSSRGSSASRATQN